jgi:type III secretion protein T
VDGGSGAWMNQLLLVGLSSARFGFAFVLVPIFAQQTIPAMVRNSVIVTLGMVAWFVQPTIDPAALSALEWARLLLKEAAAGLVIGFFFGSALWAMQAAGEVIDAKIGATIGQVLEPLGGQMTSLNGALLGRLANVIFAAGGGITLLVGAVMGSYAIWPMSTGWPELDARGLIVFENEFGRLMALVALFAAPVLVFLYVIDAGLGLLNRFAQQLNVFSLSLSIKNWAATFLLVLLIPFFAQAVLRDLGTRTALAEAVIKALAR